MPYQASDLYEGVGVPRIGVWHGSRVGGLYLANTDDLSIGYCNIEVDSVTLPSGITVRKVEGQPVERFLGRGTLAVATRHSGDGFNTYMPVSAHEDAPNMHGLTPYPDLEFGAYHFGVLLGDLDPDSLERISQGQKGLFIGSLAIDVEHLTEGL